MSGNGLNASTLGWVGFPSGLAGLAVYVIVTLRQPELVRMLNGSGLLLTSLALTQARIMIRAAQGSAAFAVQASVGLLILSIAAQAASALRNRRAWDGAERRKPRLWDEAVRRRDLAEERA